MNYPYTLLDGDLIVEDRDSTFVYFTYKGQGGDSRIDVDRVVDAIGSSNDFDLDIDANEKSICEAISEWLEEH
jgi:hypothetical protein